MIRIYVVGAVALVAVVAIWHPVAPVAPLAQPATAATHPRAPRVRAVASSDALVYVAGAVARPGVYRLAAGSRVGDAIVRAGGLLPGADPIAVNLAARVNDGDEIAVARVGETLALPARRTTSRTRRRSARARSAKQPPASPVDVNIADAAALATVPGIGATLAARIVALREQDGRFASYDELLDVAGMTEARLERAQSYLSI